MKKKFNKIIAMLLTIVMTVFNCPLNGLAATGVENIKGDNLSTAQVALYQDGALSAAYSEGEASEQYTAPEADTFEGVLYQGLKEFASKISLSKYHVPTDEGAERFTQLINANPDLFYVTNTIQYTFRTYCNDCNAYVVKTTTGAWASMDADDPSKLALCDHAESHDCYDAIIDFIPHYITDDKSKLSAMATKFNTEVEKILSGIDNSMSELEKVLYCHDYIIKSNTYDYENFVNQTVPAMSHSAYGALVQHISVCDGYSLAFSYLMKKCGINTRLVTSSIMEHAWNAVEIDGEWYFLDLTHDDPVFVYMDQQKPEDNYCYVGHKAFLASQTLWENTQYNGGNYRGWAQTDIQCTSTKYDTADWKTNKNEYSYCDGYWYYLDEKNTAIMRTEDPAVAGMKFLSLAAYNGKWPTEDQKGYWAGVFSNVSVYAPEKQLFFNTSDTIYMVDLTDDSKTLTPYMDLNSLNVSAGNSFYGMIIVGDTLYLGVQNHPQVKAKVYERSLNKNFKLGDVDNDGNINSNDALAVLRYEVQISLTTQFNEAAADVDHNRKIDSSDALAILRYEVQIITEF